ncbi:MAG: molybdate ABC transporter permease subunit [Acidobacteria bacterium]|nr:MAG: molybdate ABC transporter permease subunit [Acidobacteriota bacterium]
MDWQAFWLTFRLAVIVTAVLLALGLPIAYWIAFSRWRWKFLCEAVVALPIVLPPTVLGFYVLIALGTHSPLGRWWQSMTGHTLAFTFEGLVIGSVLYSLPFAVQPFAASFSAVDRRLLNAFAHTIGEFGVVLMVGGNIPGVTRTMSINIFDQVQDLNYAAANTTSLVLLVIAFALLSVVYSLNRRFWSLWPRP